MRRHPHPHEARMSEALDALKALFPGQPVVCLIAFPTTDPQTTDICTASNLIPEHQREVLATVLEGLEPIPQDHSLN